VPRSPITSLPPVAVLVSVLLAGGLGGCGRDAAALGPFPGADLVVVSIDSLRADHVGAYGYARETSPTIDGLAARGIRFEDALSTTSWTLPAHAALFTGLSDGVHGLVFDGLRLGEGHVTLADTLRGAGYHTAGFYGGPYLHPTFGLDRGFDVWRSCMTRIPTDAEEPDVRAEARTGARTAHRDVTGPRTRDEVARWLEDLDERPFFLFLHLWDVHYDYIPPRRYVEMFDPGYESDLRFDFRSPDVHREMDPRDLAHFVALYDGEIRFTDDILGDILALLQARGRLDDAVVLVTADHGEEFFDHGDKGHRRTLYDEVLRVPLILRLPGGAGAGRVVPDQVGLVDVMPTLLALLGVRPVQEAQGRDLTPLLRGGAVEATPLLAELHWPKFVLRAARTSRDKIIRDGRAFEAYFDLERDPAERFPLDDPEALQAARGRLTEATARSAALRERLGVGAAVASAVDEDVRSRLEALGYLEGPP